MDRRRDFVRDRSLISDSRRVGATELKGGSQFPPYEKGESAESFFYHAEGGWGPGGGY